MENWGIGVTITIRNLCMNNSVEDLIWFNEGHLGLLKLHVHLGWGFPVWGGGEEEPSLCCIASGKSSVTRFLLQDFDIWYLILKCNVIKRTLVA